METEAAFSRARSNALFILLLAFLLTLTVPACRPKKQLDSEELSKLKAENEKLQKSIQDQSALTAKLKNAENETERVRKDLETALVKAEALDREVENTKAEMAKARSEAAAEKPAPAPEQPAKEEGPKLDDIVPSLRSVADSAYAKGWYPEACELLLVMDHLGRGDVLTEFRLGYAYTVMGYEDDAVKRYEKAIALAKSSEKDLKEEHKAAVVKACNNLGVLYMRRNKPEDARRCFDESLRLEPTYAPAHFNLAALLANSLGKPKEAIEHFRQHALLGGERSASAEEMIKELSGGKGK